MAYTLTTMTDEVEALLDDSGNSYVSAAEIEDAIRWALHRYSVEDPRLAVGTISDVDGQAEYDIPGSFAGFLYVVTVWWPYDSSETPPLLYEVTWQMIDDDTLWIDADPDGDYELRVQYAAEHTLNGLDDASATTLDSRAEQLLITGAAGRSLLTNLRNEIDQVQVSESETAEWRRWAADRLAAFEYGLGEVRREKAQRGVTPDARVAWG